MSRNLDFLLSGSLSINFYVLRLRDSFLHNFLNLFVFKISGFFLSYHSVELNVISSRELISVPGGYFSVF